MVSPSPLILVVGMHRSGTSLLGSMLPQLGIALPGPLLGADQHNPEGYFERGDVTELQEELLIELGHWWPSREGVQPLPAHWLQHPASQRCKAELRRLLSREQALQQGPWAIKDPRTSLLLPLWRQLSTELRLPLQLVLSVRHPREVMRSLLQRDRSAAGMTAWRAQQLWWRHNLQILRDAEGLPLHVIHYCRWFSDPQPQLERLAEACGAGAAPTEQLEAARAQIKAGHRRSTSRLAWPPLHPKLGRLERRLLRLADQPSSRLSLQHWAARQPSVLTLPLVPQ